MREDTALYLFLSTFLVGARVLRIACTTHTVGNNAIHTTGLDASRRSQSCLLIALALVAMSACVSLVVVLLPAEEEKMNATMSTRIVFERRNESRMPPIEQIDA